MARAKRTDRAEARRRYRKTAVEASAELDDGADATAEALDFGERKSGDRADRQQAAAAKPDPNARPGFGAAFRNAYRPANIREDLRLLPRTLRSRGFLVASLMVLGGGAAALAFPGYDGSLFAFELLVWPGSAIAPQLVAGFFAPRASYLLGFIVGLLQGVVFTLLLTTFGSRLGTSVSADQIGDLLLLGFVSGPFGGMLFAAAAAWYRRFLAMTSPRRAQGARGGSQRRTSSR